MVTPDLEVILILLGGGVWWTPGAYWLVGLAYSVCSRLVKQTVSKWWMSTKLISEAAL